MHLTTTKKKNNASDEGEEYYAPTLELDIFIQTQQGKSKPPVPVLIREGRDKYDGQPFKSDIAIQLENNINHLGESPQNPTKNKIKEAQEEITKWVEEKLTEPKSLHNFIDYMQKQCQIIIVKTTNPDDAFRMFESLNSKSDPLTAIEVFKSKAERFCQDSNKYSIEIEKCFDQINRYIDYDMNERDKIINLSNTLVANSCQVFDGEQRRKSFPILKNYLDTKINEEQIEQYLETLANTAYFCKDIWRKREVCANPTH